MELSLWITLALGIVTVVATVVVPITISRRDNPKRELVYEVQAERLLGSSVRDLGLVVTHNGVTLENPFLVTLAVFSTGRADIGSDLFDDRRPIRFNISVPVLVDLDESDDDTETPRLRFNAERNAYEIRPTLIRKTESASCRFLVEGRPAIDVVSPLRDIEVKSEDVYFRLKLRRKTRLRWFSAVGYAMLFAITAIVLANVFPTPDDSPLVAPWLGVIGGVAVALGAFAYSATSSVGRDFARLSGMR